MRRVLGSALALGLLLAAWVPSAPVSAATQITVGLSHVDGKAPFNTNDDAGHDSSPTNDRVRTNDEIVYRVAVAADVEAAPSPTITLSLPRGVEMAALPGFCQAGSSLTPQRLPAPTSPMVAGADTGLGTQTVVCKVATVQPGAAQAFSFPVTVRPEMPNGSTIAAPTAVVDPDDGAADTSRTVTDATAIRVSATSKWDVSINGSEIMPEGENSAFVKQETVQKCSAPALTNQWCFVGGYPVTLSIPDGGRGGVPMAGGNFSFDMEVDPVTLWGAKAEGLDPKLYGGYLTIRQDSPYGSAFSRLTAAGATPANAVRNSGTVTTSQPGGPGTPIHVSVTGADTSAYTVPTDAGDPVGKKLWAERGYVFTQRVFVEVPMLNVSGNAQFDDDTSPGRFAAKVTVQANESTLKFTSLDGSSNAYADPDGTFNNYRRSTAVTEDSQGLQTFFRSSFLNPTATDPKVFSPGFPIWVGPSGPAGKDQGDGVAVTNETVVADLHLSGNVSSGTTTLMCQTWDNQKLNLQPGTAATYPDASGDRRYGYLPQYTDAGPVWLSYSMVNFNDFTTGQPVADRFGAFKVEYGTGTVGETNCEDPGISWSDTVPADLGSITHVRVFLQNKFGWNAQLQRSTVSVGFKVVATELGTDIPVWAGYSQMQGLVSYDQFMADSGRTWQTSGYDPAADTEFTSPDDTTREGRQGDKLTLVGAMGRVVKETWNPQKNDWTGTDQWVPHTDSWISTATVNAAGADVLPIYGPGDTIQFRLTPALRSALKTDGQTADLMVEDCLPPNTVFDGVAAGSPAPTWIGNPLATSTLKCGAGEAYVGWLFKGADVNGPLPAIVVNAKVVETSPSSVMRNTAQAAIPGVDFSSQDQRRAVSRARIQSPDGMSISKTAEPTVVYVDSNDWSSTSEITWHLVAAIRGDARPELTNIDIIDRLPADGLAESDFSATGDFIRAVVVPADPDKGIVDDGIEISYTSADPATISTDPDDPSNAASGATAWCDAPVGGELVSGSGDCPAQASEVTGLRIQRAEAFGSDERFQVDVTTSALTTTHAAVATGEVMRNEIQGRVDGIATPMASRARVDFRQSPYLSTGSISGTVWDDVNGNGVRDADEAPLAGVRVTVTGTDVNGELVDRTVTTDAEGNYLVDGLYANADDDTTGYTVTVEQLPARALTSQSNPAWDASATDSDINPAIGSTSVRLGREAQFVRVDAGYVPLRVEKSVSQDEAKVGDTLEYSIVLSNPGAADYTDEHPAVLVDDLTDVRDVGEVLPDSLSDGAVLVGNQLRWSGPLAGGDSVTITYRVKLTAVADGDAVNVAFAPVPGPDSPTTAVDLSDPDPIPVPDLAECGPSPSCASTETPIGPAPDVPTPTDSASPSPSPSPSESPTETVSPSPSPSTSPTTGPTSPSRPPTPGLPDTGC